MPYIITTHMPTGTPSDPGHITVTRRAVADLAADISDEWRVVEWRGRTYEIAPSGDTIGPLPDGTVIQVERVDRARLLTIVPERDSRASDAELVDAYNAAQGV